MEKSEAAQPPKENFIKRGINNFKSSVDRRTEEMQIATQSMLQQSMLRQFMPLVKKAIPGIERKLKNFLSGTENEDFPADGLQKMVLMRIKPSGELEIKVLNSALVSLTVNAETAEEAKSAIIKNITVDEYIEGFLTGKFDATTEDFSEQV